MGCLAEVLLIRFFLQVLRFVIELLWHAVLFLAMGLVRIFQIGNRRGTLAVTTPTESPVGVNTVGMVVGGVCFALIPVMVAIGGEVMGWMMAIMGVGWIVAVGSGGLWRLWVSLGRDPAPALEARGMTAYEIQLPLVEWQPEQAVGLMRQLLQATPELVFEVTLDAHAIRWRMIDPYHRRSASVWRNLISAHYPSAQIEVRPYTPALGSSQVLRYTATYQLANPFPAPLRTLAEFPFLDPLQVITHALGDLHDNQRVTFTLAVGGIAHPAHEEGERLVTRSQIHPLEWLSRPALEGELWRVLTRHNRLARYVPEQQRVLQTKLNNALYYAAFWVQLDAPNAFGIRHLLETADALVGLYTHLPFNGLQWVERQPAQHTIPIETPQQAAASASPAWYQHWREGAAEAPPTLILTPEELAALWYLPHAAMTASRIDNKRTAQEMPEDVFRTAQFHHQRTRP